MSTPEEILAVICPSMLTVSGYQVYIDMASAVTSSGYFGDSYATAVALLAAHNYALSKRGMDSGIVTQKTEGKLSQSFGGFIEIKNTLELSNYGQQYKMLRDSKMAAISVSDNYVLGLIGTF